MFLRRKFCVAFAAAVCCLASAAYAQSANGSAPVPAVNSGLDAGKEENKAEPWATTTHGDWVLRCKGSAASGEKKACEIVQQLQSNNMVVAVIAFGSTSPSKPAAEMNMVVVLPNNVVVTEPVEASLDQNDKAPLKLPFRRCLPNGCFASVPPSEEVLNRWKQSNSQGRIAFTNGSNQLVALPFSFRGLGEALDAMAKS